MEKFIEEINKFTNNKYEFMLKSALLMWRVITYYAVIVISAPFSMLTKQKSVEDRAEE